MHHGLSIRRLAIVFSPDQLSMCGALFGSAPLSSAPAKHALTLCYVRVPVPVTPLRTVPSGCYALCFRERDPCSVCKPVHFPCHRRHFSRHLQRRRSLQDHSHPRVQVRFRSLPPVSRPSRVCCPSVGFDEWDIVFLLWYIVGVHARVCVLPLYV